LSSNTAISVKVPPMSADRRIFACALERGFDVGTPIDPFFFVGGDYRQFATRVQTSSKRRWHEPTRRPQRRLRSLDKRNGLAVAHHHDQNLSIRVLEERR
jgi:hypothetical protein